MTVYPYLEKTAINPVAPITIAKSATFSVYDLNDAGYLTPLNVTRLSDGAAVTTLLSDSNGYIPDFTVIDRASVVIHDSVSGFSKTLVTSAPVAGAKGDKGDTVKGDKGDPGDVQVWAANTFYPLSRTIVNPTGDLVTVITAHTSTASYDPTKFTSGAIILGKVDKGELVFNVKDSGAKGDGITDDTAAVQRAVTLALGSFGQGGTLHFEPRTYYLSSLVELANNTVIQGNGATLIKRAATDPTYVFFAAKSHGKKGYGSSIQNVTVRDLNFQGNFDAPRVGCAFSLHHARNVSIEDCTFTEMSGTGHVMDIGGSDTVTIENCIFRGSMEVAGSLYAEAIQADFSCLVGSSTPDDPGSYDGLPSINITVDNCKFLPYTKGATTYPAPTAFGSHGCIEGMWLENLRFTNNVIDSPHSDTVSGYRGVVHFVSARNITVSGNKFLNRNNASVGAIRTYVVSSAMGLSDVENPNPVSHAITPQAVSNIRVTGNRFTGFKATASPEPIVSIVGIAGTPATNIRVCDNDFDDCFITDLTTTAGPDPISIMQASVATVSGNRADQVRRLVYADTSTTLKVRDNTVTNSASFAVFIQTSTGVMVAGNTISNYMRAVHLVTCNSVKVVNNDVSGGRNQPSNYGITLSGCSRFIVSGNDVLGDSWLLAGIRAYSSSSKGIIRTNIVSGAAAQITIDADSTATVSQDGNITA